MKTGRQKDMKQRGSIVNGFCGTYHPYGHQLLIRIKGSEISILNSGCRGVEGCSCVVSREGPCKHLHAYLCLILPCDMIL